MTSAAINPAVARAVADRRRWQSGRALPPVAAARAARAEAAFARLRDAATPKNDLIDDCKTIMACSVFAHHRDAAARLLANLREPKS